MRKIACLFLTIAFLLPGACKEHKSGTFIGWRSSRGETSRRATYSGFNGKRVSTLTFQGKKSITFQYTAVVEKGRLRVEFATPDDTIHQIFSATESAKGIAGPFPLADEEYELRIYGDDTGGAYTLTWRAE